MSNRASLTKKINQILQRVLDHLERDRLRKLQKWKILLRNSLKERISKNNHRGGQIKRILNLQVVEITLV
jgi:hypothetical protein